jgi:hypothetical protein
MNRIASVNGTSGGNFVLSTQAPPSPGGSNPPFEYFANQEGAKAYPGDFDGDGMWDFALAGSKYGDVEVIFSHFGSYQNPPYWTMTVQSISPPPYFAVSTEPGVRSCAGDFDGDGKTDIAFFGVSWWHSIPIAFSNGNGTFRMTNTDVVSFPTWAASAFAQNPVVAKVVCGRFNNDDKWDIALVGGNITGDASQIAIAFSNGDGSFTPGNPSVPDFTGLAAAARYAVAGDFNGNGFSDIALVGASGWNTIPTAWFSSTAAPSWTNSPTGSTFFQNTAMVSTAQPVVGDFDSDGSQDIALTGGSNWNTIPVARPGLIGWTVTNNNVDTFPGQAAVSGTKILGAF